VNVLKHIAYISLSTSLLLAAPQDKNDTEIKSVIKSGQESTKLLLQTLGKNMKKHMKADGAIKALEFCSNEAYTLTEEVNKKLPKGIKVKRISKKFRNPINEPQKDEQVVLETFEKLKSMNVILPKQLIQRVDEHTYKYYKPLVINKQVCLKCHGNSIDTNLKRAIEDRYPQDHATNYKMGDLRGAIVVTIEK
jgi:hypothetical protein